MTDVYEGSFLNTVADHNVTGLLEINLELWHLRVQMCKARDLMV